MQLTLGMPYRHDPTIDKKLKEVQSFLGVTLSKTKYSAKKVRGLEFEITIRDLMNLYIEQNGKCALTGWDLEFTRGGSWENGTNPKAATIDRIYNSVGYKKWNVQLTCWMPNKIKGSMHNSDFIDFCKEIIKTANKYCNETDIK